MNLNMTVTLPSISQVSNTLNISDQGTKVNLIEETAVNLITASANEAYTSGFSNHIFEPVLMHPLLAQIKAELKASKSLCEIQDHIEIPLRERFKKLISLHPNLAELKFIKKNMLDVGGINLGLNFIKKSDPNMRTFMCLNLEEMTRAVKDLNGSDYEGKVSYILRTAQHENFQFTLYHVNSVLIERKKVGAEYRMKICINDSTGCHFKKGEFTRDGLDNLTGKRKKMNKLFPNRAYHALCLGDIKNVCDFYISMVQRQTDDNNCPLFSLNDVKTFHESENYFEDLETFGQLTVDSVDSNLRFVHSLPSNQMKLCQSLTSLKNYKLENQRVAELYQLPANDSAKYKPKFISSEDNSYITKSINVRAQNRLVKHFALVIACVETLSFSQLKDLATNLNSSTR